MLVVESESELLATIVEDHFYLGGFKHVEIPSGFLTRSRAKDTSPNGIQTRWRKWDSCAHSMHVNGGSR